MDKATVKIQISLESYIIQDSKYYRQITSAMNNSRSCGTYVSAGGSLTSI